MTQDGRARCHRKTELGGQIYAKMRHFFSLFRLRATQSSAGQLCGARGLIRLGSQDMHKLSLSTVRHSLPGLRNSSLTSQAHSELKGKDLRRKFSSRQTVWGGGEKTTQNSACVRQADKRKTTGTCLQVAGHRPAQTSKVFCSG